MDRPLLPVATLAAAVVVCLVEFSCSSVDPGPPAVPVQVRPMLPPPCSMLFPAAGLPGPADRCYA